MYKLCSIDTSTTMEDSGDALRQVPRGEKDEVQWRITKPEWRYSLNLSRSSFGNWITDVSNELYFISIPVTAAASANALPKRLHGVRTAIVCRDYGQNMIG